MKISRFDIAFSTPAFLGNAGQSGQWRTPPFKAQLRQWWRVANAHSKGFHVDVAEMRDEEGVLFGHAWLENDHENGSKTAARKSQVLLRLGQWSPGKPTDFSGCGQVRHPEVKFPVDAHLYLGFGPLNKANAAIQHGERNTLSIAYPEKHADLIEHALYLMDRFGTVGGRSRNGWGSYGLKPEGTSALTGVLPLQSWEKCLQRDWPHALGRDEKGPLIWHTEPHKDWKKLMRTLAEIKIGLRTKNFKFSSGKNAPRPEERHWLSYPVTNHSVSAWGSARLPNSLRFKAVPTPNGELQGVIFHMPCLPPPSFAPDLRTIESVWRQVHGFLDNSPEQKLTRSPA